jgi:hypothetical protein
MWHANIESTAPFVWACLLGVAAELPYGAVWIAVVWDAPALPGQVRLRVADVARSPFSPAPLRAFAAAA